jgi:hypothetical protein
MECIDKDNIYKDFPATTIITIACLAQVMHVCVKTLFPQGLNFISMTKATGFPKEEKESATD